MQTIDSILQAVATEFDVELSALTQRWEPNSSRELFVARNAAFWLMRQYDHTFPAILARTGHPAGTVHDGVSRVADWLKQKTHLEFRKKLARIAKRLGPKPEPQPA